MSGSGVLMPQPPGRMEAERFLSIWEAAVRWVTTRAVELRASVIIITAAFCSPVSTPMERLLDVTTSE